ncbi:hypothetical protein HKW85_25610, partial [Pseudomonas aeruginosa]|nr:hypothetical protein [Pseudomonas aeruginosa]
MRQAPAAGSDFWHARWANNQIGFHLDEINPYLMR